MEMQGKHYAIDKDKVKAIYLEQMKKMCNLLYPVNTNIDYFPTNFVVNNDEIYYIDFECNDYMEEWNFENWGIKYWSQTEEFLEYVKDGMSITIKEDGTVCVQ